MLMGKSPYRSSKYVRILLFREGNESTNKPLGRKLRIVFQWFDFGRLG